MTAALALVSLLSAFNQAKTEVSDAPRYTFEIRLMPYRPSASGDATNETLFKRTYKKDLNGALIDRRPLMFALEIDKYFWSELGLFGVGGRIGYWKVTGRTFFCGESQCTTEQITGDDLPSRGNSEQSFTIIPLSVDLVYRFDWAYRELGFPVVPYVKGGLDWHLWSVRINGEVARTANDKSAEGGVWGWHGSGGVALNIDWLEPNARAGSHGVVQGSYIFAEATYIQGDNFGMRPNTAVETSDLTILAGVSLDLD
jgi:hypothetical protein